MKKNSNLIMAIVIIINITSLLAIIIIAISMMGNPEDDKLLFLIGFELLPIGFTFCNAVALIIDTYKNTNEIKEKLEEIEKEIKRKEVIAQPYDYIQPMYNNYQNPNYQQQNQYPYNTYQQNSQMYQQNMYNQPEDKTKFF